MGPLSLNEIRSFVASKKSTKVSKKHDVDTAYCAAEDVVAMLRQGLGELHFRKFVTILARTDKKRLLRLLETQAMNTTVLNLAAAE